MKKWSIRSLPGWRVVQGATRRSVADDVMAGLLLCSLLIPAGMGYAQASGLPPVTGLYATIVPLVVYALVGPSRILVLGPDSALTALIAAVVIPLSHGDPRRAVSLAAALAIASGAFCLLASVARLGFLTDLLSLPVRQGYLSGIAIVVIVGQLPKLCGFSTRAEGVIDGVRLFARGVDGSRVNTTAMALSAAAVVAIVVLRWRRSRIPGALLVVAAAAVLAGTLDLRRRGVPLVGSMSGGLPRPFVPRLERGDWAPVLTSAFGLALVSFADSSVVSRTYAARGGYTVDPNRELAALGIANVASGFFHGFSVSASASRTPVAEAAGARSQLTGLISALTIGGLLVAAPGLLRDLPVGVLAAVVVAAALQLLQVGPAIRLYRARRSEFALLAVAFLGVVVGGAIRGVGIAVVLSLLNFIRKAWRPHVTQLVRVDGMKGYHDVDRHPEGRLVPGLLLFRFDAPVFFANAEVFRQQVVDKVRHAVVPVRRVVVCAEPVSDIDATGAAMLDALYADLRQRGITLAFAGLKGHVRDSIAPFGLVDLVGRARFHATVGEAVKTYLTEENVEWVDWEDAPHGGTDRPPD